MTTSTYTYTYTYTQTATYLGEMIMGEIADLLAMLGIASSGAVRWDLDQGAITAWIAERSLKMVVLECCRPDGPSDRSSSSRSPTASPAKGSSRTRAPQSRELARRSASSRGARPIACSARSGPPTATSRAGALAPGQRPTDSARAPSASSPTRHTRAPTSGT